MKNAAKVFGAVIGALLAFALLASVSFGWQRITAPFYGQLSERQTVQSGEFRKYSYEHFYDMCAAIQRNQRTLMSQKKALEHAEGREASRIRQRVVGLESQLQSKVSSYNADSRKEETMGQFKANDLPRSIDYETEEIAQCD